METIQQQLNALQTSVKRQRFAIVALAGIIVAGGFIAAVRPAGDATFDTITCKGWNVVEKDGKIRIMATTADGAASMAWFDKDGKIRIDAATTADGAASVSWRDKDEKARIIASTLADGNAGVSWRDKDGKARIGASTFADGDAAMTWNDKDGKMRIMAATLADGTVFLPTQNDNPPKKPSGDY